MRKFLSGFRRWQWRCRRRLAVWLVERIYGEDMLWDYDDPEQFFSDIGEWAQDSWGATANGAATVQKFSRALALPAKAYRITTRTHEDSDDVDYLYQPI